MRFWKEVKSAGIEPIIVVGPELIGPFWLANIGLVLLSAVLMAILLITYFRNFSRLRSKFVIGLMVFAFLLFADNLVAAYMYFDLAKAYGPPVAAPLLVINVIGVLGFATLLWTTMR
ncbi:hypothetical protein A3K71_05825 [archaeon RBG_16_50_20]|jgi:hypothetical protein|nr:MAG: hypothetical protein A3K71_05825 [archaeon RBG_16_50_20]